MTMDVHPYAAAYYRREVASMAALRPTAFGSLALSRESGAFALADYLCRVGRPRLRAVPVLRLGGQVWMSLTPMEVQSGYMPIRLARGRVGTAGLGLGYFVQRALRKPSVEQVVVCELRREVLELYARTFGPHPKLELRHANARLLRGERFDFFYADMYRQLLTPQAIDDMATLCGANRIGRYHWWSIEQMVLEVVCAGLGQRLPAWMRATYLPFLRLFAEHAGARAVEVYGCGAALVDELDQHGLLDRALARPPG